MLPSVIADTPRNLLIHAEGVTPHDVNRPEINSLLSPMASQ